jgi:hypothetical protein
MSGLVFFVTAMQTVETRRERSRRPFFSLLRTDQRHASEAGHLKQGI